MSVPTERATRRAGLMGSCAVVNLHGPYPVAGLSSGKRSDLSCNVPDEPAQLASERHTDLVQRQLACHAQMSKAFGQSKLCLPSPWRTMWAAWAFAKARI